MCRINGFYTYILKDDRDLFGKYINDGRERESERE